MATEAPALTAWLDDFFAAYYRQRPVNATFIGVHDHDQRLPDYSEHGLGDLRAATETLLARLEALPPEPLSETEALDRRLAEGFLRIQRWEVDSAHFRHGNPSLYVSEAVFGVLSLFLRPFAPLAQRVESAVARLAAIPALLAQGREQLRAAPAAWTERALDECVGALAFLRQGIDLLLAEEGIADARLRRAADEAAAAVEAFQHHLRTEPRLQQPDGFAAGAAALDLLLTQGHVLEHDATAIEAYAVEQLAKSEATLREGAAALGARDWHAALAQLEDSHPSAAEYLPRFAEIWQAARTHALRHELVSWPDYPLRYVPRPVWTRAAAPHLYFLFYRAPAPFDRIPLVDYLVAPLDGLNPAQQEQLLRVTNDGVITLNHVIHHGGLGHHVQNWFAYNRAESRIGRVAAVDCAARIAMFCGGTPAEGWACYATELMAETGFLTPLQRLSVEHGRARMAARAIVDVRLHTGRLTLEDAARFYQERAGMSQGAAQAEAVKNSLFPGAALMYLLGTDQIWSLRRELERRAGFSLRAFHDRFLSYGSVPVALIAQSMRAGAAAQ
ncbi:MAG TPA: DUF885 family protein [Thermomicrobiaceae bacterium]|nr:DUF885 family protein [Thermomicrobiaceae bacterium]